MDCRSLSPVSTKILRIAAETVRGTGCVGGLRSTLPDDDSQRANPASRRSRLSGFSSRSSMPAARQRSRSLASAVAVIATMGSDWPRWRSSRASA
ncbi:hypothetical protein G6F57_023305 [Rhizopus arrhizus]|nr:hypothetical protein G6F32_016813 [Rhizopus arrhizus]KAG1426638.1 hypothetical protein G6F57_023305 [Rhizopus arrhizus]